MMNPDFRRYLEEAIGHENALVAFSAFEQPASVSVRVNPFKKVGDFRGREVRWNPHGRILEQRPVFTLDPLFHGGAYYVQDSSSMFVGHAFRTLLSTFRKPSGRHIRVLDLCAAPGGLDPELLYNAAQSAGIFTVSKPGLISEVNDFFVNLHSCVSGTYEVKLPRQVSKVRDVESGKVIAEDTDTLTLDMPAWKSRWLLLE